MNGRAEEAVVDLEPRRIEAAVATFKQNFYTGVRTVLSMKGALKHVTGVPLEDLCGQAVAEMLQRDATNGDGAAQIFDGEISEHPKYKSIGAALVELCRKQHITCFQSGDVIGSLRYAILSAEVAVLIGIAIPPELSKTIAFVNQIEGKTGELAELFQYALRVVPSRIAERRMATSAMVGRTLAPETPARERNLDEMSVSELIALAAKLKYGAGRFRNTRRIIEVQKVIIGKQPNNINARFNLAVALRRAGKLDETTAELAEIDRLITSSSVHLSEKLRREIEILRENLTGQTKKQAPPRPVADKLALSNPDLPNRYENFREEMLPLCTTADLRCYSKQAWHKEDWEHVIYFADFILKRERDFPVDTCIAHAHALVQLGRLEEALRFNREIIAPLVEKDPKQQRQNDRVIDALERRLRAASRPEGDAEAEKFPEDYRQADDTMLARCTNVRKIIYWSRAAAGDGAWNRAEKFQRRIIALEPTNPKAYVVLGTILERQGRLKDAIQMVNEKLLPLLADNTDERVLTEARLTRWERELAEQGRSQGDAAPAERGAVVETAAAVLVAADNNSASAESTPAAPSSELIRQALVKAFSFIESLMDEAGNWRVLGSGLRILPEDRSPGIKREMQEINSAFKRLGILRAYEIFAVAFNELAQQIEYGDLNTKTLKAVFDQLEKLLPARSAEPAAPTKPAAQAAKPAPTSESTPEPTSFDTSRFDLFLQSLNAAVQTWPEDPERGKVWRKIPDQDRVRLAELFDEFSGRLEAADINKRTDNAFWHIFSTLRTQVLKNRSIRPDTLAQVLERIPERAAGISLVEAAEEDEPEAPNIDTSDLGKLCASLEVVSRKWEMAEGETGGVGWRKIPDEDTQTRIREAIAGFEQNHKFRRLLEKNSKLKKPYEAMKARVGMGMVHPRQLQTLAEIWDDLPA